MKNYDLKLEKLEQFYSHGEKKKLFVHRSIIKLRSKNLKICLNREEKKMIKEKRVIKNNGCVNEFESEPHCEQ